MSPERTSAAEADAAGTSGIPPEQETWNGMPIPPRPPLPGPLAAEPVLVLESGAVVPIGAGVVLGRDPLAPEHASDAVPVALDDLARSVSTSHALVQAADDGSVRVTDLHSTNGTVVVSDAEVAPCPPLVPVVVPSGGLLRLGHHEVVVRRTGERMP